MERRSKNLCSSTDRPTVGLVTGDSVFDTTLGKPIWWNGTNWVDISNSGKVDKEYDISNFSGLGQKYLAKNIQSIGGVNKNILPTTTVNGTIYIGDNKANTIYTIDSDYDLNGQTVYIPEGCTLHFDGGSLRNGSIVFNKTKLSGDVRLYTGFSASNNEQSGGYLVNGEIYASWFGVIGDGSTDDSDAMQRAIDHLNNNMITLYVDKSNIILTKTINIHPTVNYKPYKIVGPTKNDTVFRVTTGSFNGSVVFDINNYDGSCTISNIKIVFGSAAAKKVDGFKLYRIRNSIFEGLAVDGARIGLHIEGASYCTFNSCRFDYGLTGIYFNGTFNSHTYNGLHCGSNDEYGILAGVNDSFNTNGNVYWTIRNMRTETVDNTEVEVYNVSPTNIVMYGAVLEDNKRHIYVNDGVFVFDHAYIGDASLTAIENHGAYLTLSRNGNEFMGGAGTVRFRPDNNQDEINEIVIAGGNTYLNDFNMCDACSPVGSNYIKNSNCIKHTDGMLYINNVKVAEGQMSNNRIKTSKEDHIRYVQQAENYALDGSNFVMGINYNLYKGNVPSGFYSISAEPTITYVAKENGVGNVMRLTMPTCSNKRYGVIIPLRFPASMIGKYCMASIKYKYNATETHAQMMANGHYIINDAAVLTKTWQSTDYTNEIVMALYNANLRARYIQSTSWLGWTVPFLNNTEEGASDTACTVADQITIVNMPIKVKAKDDFLILMFSTNYEATFTENLVMDIMQIAVIDVNYANNMVELVDTKETFSLVTDERPTFDNAAIAEGFTINDKTLNKRIRFDGVSEWKD